MRNWLVLAALPMAAQTFTFDHYAKVARVSDLRVAPAGDRAVFVAAWPNYRANAWESEVYLLDLKTKQVRPLTQRKTAGSPRWSPGGDRLAFTAAVDGKPQIFLMAIDGGEARQLTKSPTGAGNHAWRPDGAAIAFSAAEEPPKREKPDDSFEVDGNDYLTLAAPRATHVYVVSTGDGPLPRAAERSLRGAWSLGVFTGLNWSPDGVKLAFNRQESAGSRNWERRALVLADAETGTLAGFPGVETWNCGSATPSPDGRHWALGCPVDKHVKSQSELVLLTAGKPRRLTAALDRNFSRPAWSPDSRYLVAAAPDGTGTGLWEIPVDGAPRRRELGKVSAGEVEVARDGTLYFLGSEPGRPAEAYALRPGAKTPERLTDLHSEVAALKLGKVEGMTWKSDDGLPLSGVVTYPPDFDPAKKYPVLLVIHGGPWGSSRETFSTRSQVFAAKGWIIFEPNYRGSDNHGNALYTAVYRDHGAGPGRDTMAGLALLKQKPYVDASRIGVSGWSYGGYMTTWLIGHYQGWKAAMAGAAVIDLIDDYNLNDLSLYIRAYGDTLTFPKDIALMKEQSPGTYVDNMKTPLLLLSTTGDVRVPVTQSYKLYNALKERGQDVRMVLWPVPGHFPADPWRARDVDRKWAEFFEARLK